MPDTIFALATAPGRAAIALIRLSGPGAGGLLAAMAGTLPQPRLASLRRLRDLRGEVLDKALVLWFPGPSSYTGEDSAELHLHGGPAVVEGVGDALVALGARPAEPGEFTRRAVLNGRMDLTAAEGVIDLIEAETAAQARQALRLAGGGLAVLCHGWADRLAGLLARQEALIEFEDEDLPGTLERSVGEGIASLAAEIGNRLEADAGGERIRTGLDVAILGAPNAGKSSLLNALVGREAAIVSARAGTTRDIVEARLVLAGLPAVLADTAGLREAADEIEAEGVRRALHRGEEADIVLAVLPGDAPPDPATLALLERRPCIPVVSKSDVGSLPFPGALRVSARTGQGLEELRARLEAEAMRLAPASGATLISRPRHRAALRDALAWLREAAGAALPELRADALREALRALGRLTGKVGAEEILDRVFAEFCIGK
ncbi:tRNA uridine-5-carboxymethylaminomethyl(34) synthesis GTPase MnmE [Roseomonas sp. SSH11]|uniref:tRNA modification GTPase MnmE n=1 Tax=Pararoseomonas baculiformis TaxID=2820812 RepID=A0ABS4ACJ7_9PROT|nr:tRNA uridine-5-carboxymethylaminomethyl(34) synthesis GTPase MnmE [Pararoseomonas baculiformis]MBP0444718.1 tRNA uridine-5-carboxymethylaminomethyl(34) synthesis GTPase MnmE [Pararoseomonas baculiformis]